MAARLTGLARFAADRDGTWPDFWTCGCNQRQMSAIRRRPQWKRRSKVGRRSPRRSRRSGTGYSRQWKARPPAKTCRAPHRSTDRQPARASRIASPSARVIDLAPCRPGAIRSNRVPIVPRGRPRRRKIRADGERLAQAHGRTAPGSPEPRIVQPPASLRGSQSVVPPCNIRSRFAVFGFAPVSGNTVTALPPPCDRRISQ